jgi:hypothetical protein
LVLAPVAAASALPTTEHRELLTYVMYEAAELEHLHMCEYLLAAVRCCGEVRRRDRRKLSPGQVARGEAAVSIW